ncbi:MAG: hypothetical protein AAGG99_02820, partial [Pseudomonadota bacterium]
LADPAKVQAEIFVPVADGGVLSSATDAKLFLDSDPLNPRTATITRADYEARAHQGDRVAFRVLARIEPKSQTTTPSQTDAAVRLGVRGTAQVYGAPVALGLYLFRRPITAVRQWIGL